MRISDWSSDVCSSDLFPSHDSGGKVDGMQIPKLFIEAAARLLKPDGILIMEHHENQSDLIKQALKADFKLPQTHADLTGRDRFTSARKR